LPVDYQTGAMKQFTVLLAVIGLGLCSCERHEWESETPKSSDTINLFKHDDHSGEHKKDEHKADDGHEHAKPEAEEAAPAGE
jgi:hypothetical protein